MDILKYVRRAVRKFVGESGMCEDDPRVLEAINDARRVIYPLGDWKDTVERLCVQPYCQSLTLPANVEYVIKAWNCCSPMRIENEWYTAVDDFTRCCGTPCGALIKKGDDYIAFREFPDGAFRLSVVFEDDRDTGVEIKFHGMSYSGGDVSLTRTSRGAWIWDRGGPTDHWMRGLRYVIKPRTFGRIRVCAYNDTKEIMIALYYPKDVNPRYVRYHTGAHRMGNQIMVKAKKKFIDLVEDDETVDISTDALIHVLQAITDRENRNLNGYGTNLGLGMDFERKRLSSENAMVTTHMKVSRAWRVEGLV